MFCSTWLRRVSLAMLAGLTLATIHTRATAADDTRPVRSSPFGYADYSPDDADARRPRSSPRRDDDELDISSSRMRRSLTQALQAEDHPARTPTNARMAQAKVDHAPVVPPAPEDISAAKMAPGGFDAPHPAAVSSAYGMHDCGNCGCGNGNCGCGSSGGCGHGCGVSCGCFGGSNCDCGAAGESCGYGNEAGCGSGPCGTGLFSGPSGEWHFGFRPGQWYVGADYLATRVHMSKADAFIRETTITETNGNVAQTNDIINFRFPHESSTRTFVGYHLCGCDADVQFTWTHLEGRAAAAAEAATGVVIAGHGELQAVAAGDAIIANTGVDANNYDLTCTKRFPKCCQDPCACCPTWEFSWTSGIRVIDVSRNFFSEEAFGFFRNIDIRSQFTGAGPLAGLTGRRFLHEGQLSTYITGEMALLLGDYEHRIRRDAPNGIIDTIEIQNFKDTRIIPMVDMEIGATWKPNCHWTLEAGWLLQAYFDLGMTEQHFLENQPFAEPLDTSNILSFDGLFARIQYSF